MIAGDEKSMWWLTALWIAAAVVLAAAYYWLFIITEGVYFGRRFVVWLYDLTAGRYDAIKVNTLAEERILLVEPILAELRGASRSLLLDVASGTGRVPYFLLADGRFDGRMVAVEPSRRMARLGVERLRPWPGRVDWVRQTADPLPFRSGSFDLVTSLEALEFMPSIEAALREMVRVLRPGGTLLVTRRAGWEARTFIGRYYSRQDFTVLLERLGLVETAIVSWQSNYDLALGVKKREPQGNFGPPAGENSVQSE